jgi:hypothetical protein
MNTPIIVCYHSNPGYSFMAHRLGNIIDKMGFEFKDYNREWLIKQPEFAHNKKIFDEQKGGGYWAWKPLIILDALKTADEVMYLDSSIIPVRREAILEMLSFTDKISAVATVYKNSDWTKRYCFVNMECDEERYWNAKQIWAAVVSANIIGIEILKEWRDYCLEYNIISDRNDPYNLPGFVQHRHDQSILTNLLIKHNQEPFVSKDFIDEVKYE